MAPTDWSQFTLPDNATAQDSPDVQNEAVRQRQQAQANAALDLEQSRAQMAATREQQAQAQTNRQLAGQGAASDAAQWANTPDYANQPWATAAPEAKQHFMDAWSSVPGGGTGVAEQLPEIWNEAQRNATGIPSIGLENLQEGQTASVKMGGVPVSVGKPPLVKVDQATGRSYRIDPATGEASYINIQDPQQAKGPLGEGALSGDDYLQSLNPEDAAHVKAIAEGRENPNTFGTRGNQRARIQAMVQQYDPTADAATLTKRQAVVRDFSPAGKSGQAIRSGNTAIAHLNELADTIPALNNSSVPIWNSAVANPLARNFGSQFPKAEGAFNTTSAIVADELSKFFGGKGGTTVQEVKNWHDNLNPNAPPDVLKGNIQAAIKLLADQMQNYRGTYETSMGRSKNIPFIYPETQKILDQLQQKGVNTSDARAIDSDLPQAQPSAGPATPNPAGILGTPGNVTTPPIFKTPEEVRDAFKSGALPRDQAKAILQSQFGHQ